MKVYQAPPADLGLLTQDDFVKIAETVSGTVQAARDRIADKRPAEGAPACGVVSAGRPPPNNMGGKSENAPAERAPDTPARLVLEDGEILEIPARRGWGGDAAFIDWVNYTSKETAYFHRQPGIEMFNGTPITDDEIIDRVSAVCLRIFGFGITSQRPDGANFYHRSYVLGEGCGMVCHGGQKSTVLVMLSGTGCAAAAPGWEKRLHDWLTENERNHNARITRADLAYDDITGEIYSVDRADADYDAGLFGNGGRMPDIEHRGNWKRPNGKGRTVYIGHRANGKYARVYEKGRELGDKSSEWCRVEVEMKAKSRIVPFDVLLDAGAYLAASYPAFAWVADRQERIITEQKKTEITYASMLAWLKKQCGAAINVGVAIEGSCEALIAKIIRDEIPKRLKVPSYLHGGKWLHDRQRETLPIDVSVAAW